jgi:ribosomal-protein-alanine N-acetyltransferase
LFLAVAAFNERAVKVYKNLGFKVIEEDVWNIRGKDYDFLIMKLDF